MMNDDEKYIEACKNAFGAKNVSVVETTEQALSELAKREARRQYQREWRKNNPDKVKAQRNRYWEKKGKELVGKMDPNESWMQKEHNWCWISVLDRLPANRQDVIFMSDFSGEDPRYMKIHWGWFSINKNGFHFWEKDCEIVENVLYWLPQPMYPEEDK